MNYRALLILAFAPAALQAQEHAHKAGHDHEVLGVVNFANSGNAAAQPALQRGVALLHSFEYEDAAESFRAAQSADASLAVAYWLEALTYSHVLWAEERLDKARAALARLAPTTAARLEKAKTARERSFGAAVEAFFVDAPLPQRASAFADSMLHMASAYPDDAEAAAFAALSSMFAFMSAPADQRAKYNQPVQQLALRVFDQNQQHPGAAHYLIHYTDMNPSAAKGALPFARAYDKIAPDAEHALHMPSHVYLPLGMFQEVVAANERAWAASRREVLAKQLSPADNSWHALQWLQYSYLQLGRDRDARALIDTAYALVKGVKIADDNPDARNVVAQLAFWYGTETGKWDAYPEGLPSVDVALAQPRPNGRARYMAVAAAYQAGVAHLLARNDAAPAEKVINRFRADAASPDAPDRTALLRLAGQLEALSARARGDLERAIALLREVVVNEPAGASTPPTSIPTYELLGELLLAANHRAEAAEAYQHALDTRPNRRAALRGLERAKSTTSSTDQLIEAAVLPLPVALRAGAGVRTYSRTAGATVLRQSSNGMMCTADTPGDDVFDVRCYNVEFLAVMDAVRALRKDAPGDSLLDARIQAESGAGRLKFPKQPTAGYRMLGPVRAYDAATNSVTAEIDKWQSVHFPFRTAAELGLPTEQEGTMPYVMSSGTWWSHVMIVHTAANKD